MSTLFCALLFLAQGECSLGTVSKDGVDDGCVTGAFNSGCDEYKKPNSSRRRTNDNTEGDSQTFASVVERTIPHSVHVPKLLFVLLLVSFSFGVSEVIPIICKEAPQSTVSIRSLDFLIGFAVNAFASSLR